MANFNKTYKNGLRLFLEKNDKDVVAISILFFVGSQNESKEQEGYSHFIEHLMFKSSEKNSTEEIMDKLTLYGADYNAYTSRTTTRYTFKCLKENFEPCFEIYSDMLLHPKFDIAEIDKERNVVIEEMQKCADDPVQVLYERVMNNYFGEHPFAHDELGREEIIMNVSREKLLEYKNKFYRAENCIISVAGNIDFDKLDSVVERLFSSHFDYEAKSYKVDFSPINVEPLKKYDIVSREDNQANVCVHIKSEQCKSKLKYVSDIYTSILGNSQNSRLFKLIREELGLVYSIYAFNDAGANAGEIFIIFGTRPQNIKKAMAEIKKVILNMAENGVTEDELLRAKNFKKSCVAYSSETNSDIAEINATCLHLYEKTLTPAMRVKNFDDVTLKQVNDFAKQIANEKTFNVVAVGKNLKIEHIKQF